MMSDEARRGRLDEVFRRVYWEMYKGTNDGAARFSSHLSVIEREILEFARLLENPDAMSESEQSKVVFRMVVRSMHLAAAAREIEAAGSTAGPL
jgi:hypothetical protein